MESPNGQLIQDLRINNPCLISEDTFIGLNIGDDGVYSDGVISSLLWVAVSGIIVPSMNSDCATLVIVIV